MNTGLIERLQELGTYLDAERSASTRRQDRAHIDARRLSRTAVVAIASVAAAASILAVVFVSASHTSGPSMAWAAAPDPVTPTTSAQADAACRAASSDALPAISTVDLRGEVGIVLYEMTTEWQVCTFPRNGNVPGTAHLTSISAPTGDPSEPQGAFSVVLAQTFNVTINHSRITVATGRVIGKFPEGCSADACFHTVHLQSNAGHGQTSVSPTGTFAVWVPAGTPHSWYSFSTMR